MILVALDFCRTTFVALDDKPSGKTGDRHCRGEIRRLPWDQFFGLAYIRRDILRRLSRARGQSRERQRCPNQLKKSAALNGIIPLAGVLRKLAVKQLFELRGFGELFEATPVLLPGDSRIKQGPSIK